MITVVAGRRTDAKDAKEKRFPLENIATVKDSIRKTFQSSNFKTLISSGACGADLIAMEVANEAGLECFMILPFDEQHFKKVSVTDRPGDWQVIYDPLIEKLKETEGLIVLDFSVDDPLAYEKTNTVILDKAYELSAKRSEVVMALIIWDGIAKDANDTTLHFKNEALKRGFLVNEIKTIHHD
ncbi:MAG: hypothetical protein ACXWCZ_01990 [Flavisolibacter sp.]